MLCLCETSICTLLLHCPSPYNLRIEKLSNCQSPMHQLRWAPLGWSRWEATKNSIATLNSRNNMIFIHQRSAWTSEHKISLISSDGVVLNGFIMFVTTTPLESSAQLFYRPDYFSVSFPNENQPLKTRLSQSENYAPWWTRGRFKCIIFPAC